MSGRRRTLLVVSVLLALFNHCQHARADDNDGLDPANIADNYIRDHPIGSNPSLTEAIAWERGVMDLGLSVGKAAREGFFKRMPQISAKLLLQIRRIGIDTRLDGLDAPIAKLVGLWVEVRKTTDLVRDQFLRLHRQGAEQVGRAARSSAAAIKLGKTMAQLPEDINAAAAKNEKRWHQTLAHFKETVKHLEAQIQRDRLPGEALRDGVEASWRGLVDSMVDDLQEYSADALIVHKAADKNARKVLDGLVQSNWWSWLCSEISSLTSALSEVYQK